MESRLSERKGVGIVNQFIRVNGYLSFEKGNRRYVREVLVSDTCKLKMQLYRYNGNSHPNYFWVGLHELVHSRHSSRFVLRRNTNGFWITSAN
jgi:hypothetical protein